MERLTGDVIGWKIGVTKEDLANKLRPFENIGLTPDQIQILKERDTAKKPLQSEEGMICPVCGSKALPWSRFCDECGQRWWED